MAGAAYNLGVIAGATNKAEAARWCLRAHRIKPESGKYAHALAFYQRESGDRAAAGLLYRSAVANEGIPDDQRRDRQGTSTPRRLHSALTRPPGPTQTRGRPRPRQPAAASGSKRAITPVSSEPGSTTEIARTTARPMSSLTPKRANWSSLDRPRQAEGNLLPWHRRSSYEPDAPARGMPQSPRWRVGLVCARMRNFLAGVISCRDAGL